VTSLQFGKIDLSIQLNKSHHKASAICEDFIFKRNSDSKMSNRATGGAGKPPLYKIVMLGDSGVGKTSLGTEQFRQIAEIRL
jgi:GTPase SAR1 family protein